MSIALQPQLKMTQAPTLTTVRAGVLQRACACGQHTGAGGECESCRQKRLSMQRQASTTASPTVAPPIVHEVLGTPGQPLDAATRASMEPRFDHDFSRVPVVAPQHAPAELTVGRSDDRYEQEAEHTAESVMRAPAASARAEYDFSRVRVHTGAQAAASARAVNARAYTVGQNIVFGAGQYAPGTSAGQRLLAHELAHTIQQAGGGASAQLQRTIGDGHDLAAARFAGDAVLEALFDGEQILRKGAKGQAVQKIQQALLDLGFALPAFGADGDFGDETEAAVRDFQRDSDLSFMEIDGRVGPQTMGLLDARFPGAAPGPGGLSEQDVADPRIDPSAQASLIRLSRGDADQQEAANGLLSTVKSADLAGIIGQGLAQVTISPQLDAFWAPLPAAFQGAVLARDPAQPETPPTVVFREPLRLDDAGLDAALQRAREIQTGAFPPPPCSTGPDVVTVAAFAEGEGDAGASPIVCQSGGGGGGGGGVARAPFLSSLEIIPERGPTSEVVILNTHGTPAEFPKIDCKCMFRAVVKAEPQHAGKIFFRQFVMTLTRKDDLCGRGPMRVVKGPALDNRLIYNEPSTRTDGTGVITLTSGIAQNVTMIDGDAPFQGVDNPCFFAAKARVALFASDEFRLIVMWQPPTGAPVALGHKGWGWRARGGFSKLGSEIGESNWTHGVSADSAGPFITSTLDRPGVEPATKEIITNDTIMSGKEPADPF